MLNDEDEMTLRRELDLAHNQLREAEDLYALVDDQSMQRAEQVARRDRLIRYLAIPLSYQDPEGEMVFLDPDFVTFDPYTKQPLMMNIELKRVWHRVVRGIDLDDDGELPEGTVVTTKAGWVTGVKHARVDDDGVTVITESPASAEEERGVGLADAPQQGE